MNIFPEKRHFTGLTWLKSPKHRTLLAEASETHTWQIFNFLICNAIFLEFALILDFIEGYLYNNSYFALPLGR